MRADFLTVHLSGFLVTHARHLRLFVKVISAVHSIDVRIYWSSVWTADPSVTRVTCKDGDVRLRDGSNELEGRLEICINNAWGTVCQEEFTSVDEASIVCANLGYDNGGLGLFAWC